MLSTKRWGRAAVALGFALGAACAEKAEPVRQGPVLPAAPLQALASISAEVVPPSRGPGGDRVPGRTLWTVTPTGTDGASGTNPPQTIQLKSIGVFDFAGAGTHACGNDPLEAQVEITNFFPERLANAHFVFSNVSDTDRALCSDGLGGGFSRPGDWPAVGFDAIYYVTPSAAAPLSSIAGSLRSDGQAAGGSVQQRWSFDYAAGTPAPFTFRGDLYAQLYPSRPYPIGFGPTGSESFIFGGVEVGENPLHWAVIDRGDAPGGFGDSPLADPRIVNGSVFQVCTPGAGNTCGSVLYTATVGSTWTREDLSEFYHPMPTGPDFTPGTSVVLTMRNQWDPDGNGPAGAVQGSLVYQELVTIAGLPNPITPADADVPAGGTLSWSVVSPESFFTSPWFVDGTRVGWNRVVWQLCTDASCNTVRLECPNGSAGCAVNPFDETTYSVEGQTYTYNLALTPGIVAAASLTASNTYYWRVHNLLTGRVGVWSTPRAFRFTGP